MDVINTLYSRNLLFEVETILDQMDNADLVSMASVCKTWQGIIFASRRMEPKESQMERFIKDLKRSGPYNSVDDTFQLWSSPYPVLGGDSLPPKYMVGHRYLFECRDTHGTLRVFQVDWELQNGSQITKPLDIKLDTPGEWHTMDIKTSYKFHEDSLASRLIVVGGAFIDNDDTMTHRLFLFNHIDKTRHGFLEFGQATVFAEIIFDASYLTVCLRDYNDDTSYIKLWRIAQDLESFDLQDSVLISPHLDCQYKAHGNSVFCVSSRSITMYTFDNGKIVQLWRTEEWVPVSQDRCQRVVEGLNSQYLVVKSQKSRERLVTHILDVSNKAAPPTLVFEIPRLEKEGLLFRFDLYLFGRNHLWIQYGSETSILSIEDLKNVDRTTLENSAVMQLIEDNVTFQNGGRVKDIVPFCGCCGGVIVFGSGHHIVPFIPHRHSVYAIRKNNPALSLKL